MYFLSPCLLVPFSFLWYTSSVLPSSLPLLSLLALLVWYAVCITLFSFWWVLVSFSSSLFLETPELLSFLSFSSNCLLSLIICSPSSLFCSDFCCLTSLFPLILISLPYITVLLSRFFPSSSPDASSSINYLCGFCDVLKFSSVFSSLKNWFSIRSSLFYTFLMSDCSLSLLSCLWNFKIFSVYLLFLTVVYSIFSFMYFLQLSSSFFQRFLCLQHCFCHLIPAQHFDYLLCCCHLSRDHNKLLDLTYKCVLETTDLYKLFW